MFCIRLGVIGISLFLNAYILITHVHTVDCQSLDVMPDNTTLQITAYTDHYVCARLISIYICIGSLNPFFE